MRFVYINERNQSSSWTFFRSSQIYILDSIFRPVMVKGISQVRVNETYFSVWLPNKFVTFTIFVQKYILYGFEQHGEAGGNRPYAS